MCNEAPSPIVLLRPPPLHHLTLIHPRNQNCVGALLFFIEVSGLCTCSPSSGFLWNETGEN